MTTNLLNLSDEELMNLDPSALEEFNLGPEEALDDEEELPEDTSEDQGKPEEENPSNDEGSDEEPTEDDSSEDEESETSEDVEDDGAEEEAPEEQAKEKAAPAEATIDYKSEYERLLAPFKANGREVKVASVEDAVSLMQMGANYSKKMAALKPNLRLMKMLENSGLLSEEKLSFLIDLEKKDPAAISKLVNESGIDPLELDSEKAKAYTPNSYAVNDKEVALDMVLEEIRETPSYDRTLDVVSNKWDRESKQAIANQPQLLKVINDHVDRGIYDIIVKEIEQERMFGRLGDISDLDAYRQVGDAIQARGGFADLGRQKQTTPTAPVVVPPKPKKVEDPKIRDKRRAAGTTKSTGSSIPSADFNPLSMSDEDFSKAANQKFL